MTCEYHKPVLVQKVLEYLITKKDGVYVDATLGGGGHSGKILEILLPTGVLIGIDADEDAINFSKKRFGDKVCFIHGNFSHLSQLLSDIHISKVDGILFDLGISSYQIDVPEKGFSFRNEGYLDLRFDKRQSLDARTVINTYDEKRLVEIFFRYGEEKYSRRIANKIVTERTHENISQTSELVQVIRSVVGERFLNKTLARIFQAIRIEVNQELTALEAALTDAVKILNPGGRLVVISYHSLEDRIIKEIFKKNSISEIPSGNKLVPNFKVIPEIKILTKKPILPDEEELITNPRSRSAKLRSVEKLNIL
jgi:16S rRNA (cytosine1402-N4)-methyltransferase